MCWGILSKFQVSEKVLPHSKKLHTVMQNILDLEYVVYNIQKPWYGPFKS